MLITILLIHSTFMLSDVLLGEAHKANFHPKKIDSFSKTQIKDKELRFVENVQKRPRLLKIVVFVALFLLIGGLFLDVYFASKVLGGESWISNHFLSGPARWGIRELIQLFTFLFFIEAVLLFVEALANSFLDLKTMPGDLVLMGNSLFRDAAVAVAVLWTVQKKFGQKLSDLGLNFHQWIKSVWTGLTGYVAILPPLCLILFMTALAAKVFAFEPEPQAVVQIYLKDSSQRYLLFFTIFVAVMGPMFEEIFFRGFLYKGLREKLGVRNAAFFSAALFSAMHMNLIAFFPIFFLGLFLVYLYEKSGTLVPSMTAHITHNLLMVCFTLWFKSVSA